MPFASVLNEEWRYSHINSMNIITPTHLVLVIMKLLKTWYYHFIIMTSLYSIYYLAPNWALQVNQKMMLTLTASIMFWCLQNKGVEPEDLSPASSTASEAVVAAEMSTMSVEDGNDQPPPEAGDEKSVLQDQSIWRGIYLLLYIHI